MIANSKDPGSTVRDSSHLTSFHRMELVAGRSETSFCSESTVFGRTTVELARDTIEHMPCALGKLFHLLSITSFFLLSKVK